MPPQGGGQVSDGLREPLLKTALAEVFSQEAGDHCPSLLEEMTVDPVITDNREKPLPGQDIYEEAGVLGGVVHRELLKLRPGMVIGQVEPLALPVGKALQVDHHSELGATPPLECPDIGLDRPSQGFKPLGFRKGPPF